MKNKLLPFGFLAALVVVMIAAAPPPPIIRSWLTTNYSTGTFLNAQVPTWDTASKTWKPGTGGSVLTTNANQFLGIPLSIKDGALETNINLFGTTVTTGDIMPDANNTRNIGGGVSGLTFHTINAQLFEIGANQTGFIDDSDGTGNIFFDASQSFTFDAPLLPAAGFTLDIGTAVKPWRNIFAQNQVSVFGPVGNVVRANLKIASTNGNSGVSFSVPVNAPNTNNFVLDLTPMTVGQVLSVQGVSGQTVTLTNSTPVTVGSITNIVTVAAGANITVATNRNGNTQTVFTVSGTASTGIATNNGSGTNNVFTEPRIVGTNTDSDATHGVFFYDENLPVLTWTNGQSILTAGWFLQPDGEFGLLSDEFGGVFMAVDNVGLRLQNLTANRAVTSDAGLHLVSSSTTDTELGYVSGVTSSIQTQLNSKGGPQTNIVIGSNGVTAANVSSLMFSNGLGTTVTIKSNAGVASITINVPSVTSQMTQTNFVLNTVYTNSGVTPVTLCAKVFIIPGLVNGSASIDLMVSYQAGAYASLAGASIATLLSGGIALPITNTVCYVVTNLCSYYWTNSSSAGDSAGIVAGTGQITVDGGGATGATGPQGPAGTSVSVSTNGTYVTSAATNIDFAVSTNLVRVATNNPAGNVGLGLNTIQPITTNAQVTFSNVTVSGQFTGNGAGITNLNYQPVSQLLTNYGQVQFLGSNNLEQLDFSLGRTIYITNILGGTQVTNYFTNAYNGAEIDLHWQGGITNIGLTWPTATPGYTLNWLSGTNTLSRSNKWCEVNIKCLIYGSPLVTNLNVNFVEQP